MNLTARVSCGHAGLPKGHAAIQRCQVHKRRNVLDHLTDEQKPGVAKRLNAAYALEDYAAAKQALNQLHRELMDLNPSAARSLGEGMEETLTVHRLHVPMQLRKTLASTNVIESAFSIVERVCRNVKRWHGGDQRERWVGSGLLVAQKQFRRITGYKQIPALSENWKRWRRLNRQLSRGERRRRVGYAGVVTFNGTLGISPAGRPHAFSPRGERMLVLHQSSQRPSDIWVYDLASSKPQQLTFSAIASLSPGTLPPSQIVHFKSFDGQMISALLWLPFDAKRDRTLTGIVVPHGGPTGQR